MLDVYKCPSNVNCSNEAYSVRISLSSRHRHSSCRRANRPKSVPDFHPVSASAHALRLHHTSRADHRPPPSRAAALFPSRTPKPDPWCRTDRPVSHRHSSLCSQRASSYGLGIPRHWRYEWHSECERCEWREGHRVPLQSLRADSVWSMWFHLIYIEWAQWIIWSMRPHKSVSALGLFASFQTSTLERERERARLLII